MTHSLKLYDFWRSGSSHRVRIALALKGLDAERVSIDLRANAHLSAQYGAINPQHLAPALETDEGVLTQSQAIIEWLDETYTLPPLLPRATQARARARAVAAIVACDMHPLGNLRVLRWLSERGLDGAEFASHWWRSGFEAIEALIDPESLWCFGDTPGMADCFVVPQAFAARERYNLVLPPRVAAVLAVSERHPAFIAAAPQAPS